MAQPPHKPSSNKDERGPHGTKPSEDEQGAQKDRHPTPHDDKLHQQGEFKDQHVPLRDPNAGKGPAIGGGHLTTQGGERVYEGPADPPVETIGDLQRKQSAHYEEMGDQAYHAEGQAVIDQQLEREGRQGTVPGVGYRRDEDDEPRHPTKAR